MSVGSLLHTNTSPIAAAHAYILVFTLLLCALMCTAISATCDSVCLSHSYLGAHLERRHSQQGHPSKRVLQLMEKIPEEAESLTVMVGGVKFLEKPVVAFVRLAQVRVFVRFVRI